MQSQGVNVPSAQQMRFSKPKVAGSAAPKVYRKPVQGLLKDNNIRPTRPGWNPSFLTAFRIIILVRFFSGMYSNISDCDEVYNYWEPLHYLLRGTGFQTWEYSPLYAIRSYFYLLVNSLPTIVMNRFHDKRAAFFLLRLSFASVSSLVEALFYRSVCDYISPHVGRYVLFGLTFSAGFWSAATAFLPSTFAMWGVLVASAASLSPVGPGWRRISFAVTAFAIAAVVGWPFVLVLAVPMVMEQLFVAGNEVVKPGTSALWAAQRARNLLIGGLFGALTLIPVILVDSQAYKKLTIVPWNIIEYNLLSSKTSSTLYGVEGPSYYFKTSLLAFNLYFVLALLSLPILFITTIVDPKRFGDLRERVKGTTNPAVNVAIRLAPFYLWFTVLTLQSHKEERFMYPAYGLIVFNGSVGLYLIRGWIEMAYLKATVSPWKTSQTTLFSQITRTFITISVVISLLRICALHTYYHAPLNVYHHLQTLELPRLALQHFPHINPDIAADLPLANFSLALDEAPVQVDIAPLFELDLSLCLGKEWHRFPSHFLVPDEVKVNYIPSAFRGILPKKWQKGGEGMGLFGRATGVVPSGMNNQNKFEADRFVDPSTCSYIVDLDFPHRFSRSSPPPEEPRYAIHPDWEKVKCTPFLDNENSGRWTRVLWLPLPQWQRRNEFGEYCLLRRKGL